MSKTTNNTSEEIRASVSSIYAQLLSKRREEKEAREEQKRQEDELREQEKEASKLNEDGTKMSKKERRAAEFDNWKEVIIGLTGDDLEYSDSGKKEKKKKKYKKWIDDDNESSALTPKPKKVKKKNYNKEFAPELQMLKNIVADQNRFTADLQKRFNTMAGPANKDAMPPNKTMVELASVINAGRSNSLGVLKEIGNLKKVIAELYMKQRKEDLENGSGSIGPVDLALMGSSVASNIFADEPLMNTPVSTPATNSYSGSMTTPPNTINVTATPVDTPAPVAVPQQVIPVVNQYQEFDPASWDGPSDLKLNPSVHFETIPHSVVVEMDGEGNRRFKAIRDDNGEELDGCPVPTYDPKVLVINEKDKIAKGQFDETYRVEII